MSLERFKPSSSVSGWLDTGITLNYEPLTFTATGTLSVTGNGTTNVSIFKTSGADNWDAQAYASTAFTAPCTIEFNKWAGYQDNGRSYAMIGWNTDPTTNASYDTIDYASYPYAMTLYEVYNNGTYILPPVRNWSRTSKFYIVYGTDGYIRHYNGSTQMYSVSVGTGLTYYIDSSFTRLGATFSGFSNIRAIKRAWNGTSYT
jgi:hypothetical protein